MASVRRFGTGVEVRVRKALWRRGLRYRLHRPIGSARPDIVFVRARLAVFIDGCFWHGCPDHFKLPATNTKFWGEKIDRNRQRDAAQDRELREAGWLVLRYWGCQVKADAEAIADQIERAVHQRRLT